jgi:endonuclease/exonuclease/phosphatase family metal-dependent hydrolase
VAKCLEGLDFVALQEVHGPRPWENLDQAGELGGRLHMDWLFAPNTRDWRCLDFGNGLLSTTPVESWQRIPLANYGGRGYRNAVLVSLKRRQGDVRVLLTHISRSNDRERTEQLRTVIAMFLALREPAILLGDLNSEATDPQIRALLATPGVTDAVGKILGEKDEPGRIDWIIARGMRATKAGIRDNEASDHPAVWAELEQ